MLESRQSASANSPLVARGAGGTVGSRGRKVAAPERLPSSEDTPAGQRLNAGAGTGESLCHPGRPREPCFPPPGVPKPQRLMMLQKAAATLSDSGAALWLDGASLLRGSLPRNARSRVVWPALPEAPGRPIILSPLQLRNLGRRSCRRVSCRCLLVQLIRRAG